MVAYGIERKISLFFVRSQKNDRRNRETGAFDASQVKCCLSAILKSGAKQPTNRAKSADFFIHILDRKPSRPAAWQQPATSIGIRRPIDAMPSHCFWARLLNEIMAELYGKATGNAKGRGGSMHLFTDRMLGGLAIVGSHVPIATGAAFSIKYLKQKGLVSFCFLGDGAVAQGAFHESLNLASLWNLPCIYVIENNQWGMGTAAERAIAVESDRRAFLQ